MPNGCNVLALFMRWASRAFRTESRLLRMSSIGMRRTSLIEWPAWLKWSDICVVVLSCWWFRIERRCSPKRSLSWRLVSPMYWTEVAPFTFYQVYKIFGVARYGVRDFSSFVGVAMCCDMLGVVGSSLKMVKSEPTTPNTSQHVATRWSNASNMLRPTMLRYVALACCDRLAGAL